LKVAAEEEDNQQDDEDNIEDSEEVSEAPKEAGGDYGSEDELSKSLGSEQLDDYMEDLEEMQDV
jgi:hypothetical protein